MTDRRQTDVIIMTIARPLLNGLLYTFSSSQLSAACLVFQRESLYRVA